MEDKSNKIVNQVDDPALKTGQKARFRSFKTIKCDGSFVKTSFVSVFFKTQCLAIFCFRLTNKSLRSWDFLSMSVEFKFATCFGSQFLV